MDVNYIDIAIVVIMLITALIGFMRGFVWMAVFLATWSAAILLAFRFKDQLALALPIKLGSEVAQIGLAALLIFIGVLIIGAIINYLFSKAVSAIGLGTFDRILGTGLGVALGALAITLVIMLVSLTEYPNQATWQKSKFVPKFQEAATWIQTLIPEDFNNVINSNLKSSENVDPVINNAIVPGDAPSTTTPTTAPLTQPASQ
ncbi:MAG TPA: CvpA family protein [Leucothrix mucor]|nr:CvpA family protein [Leucothrix mucor]